jgi:putative membrane protein
MIQYNPKDWFTFIFKLHKADTIRKLAWMMITIAIYTVIIVLLEREVFHLSDKSDLKNIVVLHTLLGGVISLLLVFRTNTAYDRWWEGRKLWGALVNNTRSLATKVHSLLPDELPDKMDLKKYIILYPYALRTHLQKKGMEEELFDQDELGHVFSRLNSDGHVPNQIALNIFEIVYSLQKRGILSEFDLLLINDEIKNYSDVCGACERIHNTPIPYSYGVFLKKFIFFYVMTLPIGFSFILGYLSIPIVVFIFYVLASLELIAEEIEDPFGDDPNDLPMLRIADNLQIQVNEIFSITMN